MRSQRGQPDDDMTRAHRNVTIQPCLHLLRQTSDDELDGLDERQRSSVGHQAVVVEYLATGGDVDESGGAHVV
jgi:hypothetical protein